MMVRMANHEDSTVISNIELQAASLFPDELLPKALCDKTLPLYEIESAIEEQRLTTFRDFIPSRRLYDKFGFVLLELDDIPDE